MADLQGRLGIWTLDTSTALGNLHHVKALGFEYVIARIVYHPKGSAEPYEPMALSQLLADAATIDLPVYAWAYCYPTAIEQQVATIARALPNPCRNLVLDIESEWEGRPQAAAAAHALFHGIAAAIGHRADLHLSSFYNPNRHPLPYTACLAHCQSFMPQTYRVPPTSVATVISRALAQDPPFARLSLGGLLIPTSNRPEMLFAAARHQDVFAGANVWLWDGDSDDFGVRGREPDWRPAIAAYQKAAVGH